MELHLHLTVAFRALDRKWDVVDLEDSCNKTPAYPAMVERPTTTFSSEEFLRKRFRPKPYSRYEENKKRRNNLKINDSFADISSSNLPVYDFDVTSMDSGLDEGSDTVSDLVERLESSKDNLRSDFGSSIESLDSMLEEKKATGGILKQWKAAKAYIEKCKRKLRS